MKSLNKMYVALIFMLTSFSQASWASQSVNLDELVLDNHEISAVAVSGLITTRMAQNLSLKLARNLQSGKRTAIMISSSGGVIEQTAQVADTILRFAGKYYAKKKVSTLLIFNQECTSACTVLAAYLNRHHDPQELEILATDNAEFTFHAPRQLLGGRFVALSDTKEFEFAVSVLFAAYLNSGVNPEFLMQNRAIFLDPSAEIAISAKTLCHSRAGLLPTHACVPPKFLFENLESVLSSKKGFSDLKSGYLFLRGWGAF